MRDLFRIPLGVTAIFLTTLLLYGCPSDTPPPNNTGSDTKYEGKKSGDANVVIHELSDPDMLHGTNSTSASATYVKYNIYMYLLDIDKDALTLSPALVKEVPEVVEITDGDFAGGLSITYEIREEAIWDDGEPVTAYDAAFTYKATLNPMVDAEHRRSYIDFIHKMEIDESNPKRFTIYSRDKYYYALYGSGNTFIIPEHIYDPSQVMRGFTFDQLTDPSQTAEIRGNADIIAFAKEFNSEKYQRETEGVIGNGPYRLKEWITSQRIILERKENWWGDQFAGSVVGFDAAPARISYEIINDWTTAITAMKDEQIDLARNIKPKDYVDLTDNGSFNNNYNLYAPHQLSYTYIGINMKDERLEDKRVRKALAHTVDRDKIINILVYGLADYMNSPIHPSKTYHNNDIAGYEYDLDKANALLDESGWIDTDGDGIRDKIIDGEKVDLALIFKYNSGNTVREGVGTMLKEDAAKVGIDIEVVSREWTVFIDETKNHDFDLYCGGWVSDPISDDMTQLWHTRSYNGGSNYVGFGDIESDQIIEQLRVEMDEAERDRLYKRMQEITYEEVPYVFLYTPKNLLAIHKRFDNAKAYVARPGYTERNFTLIP